MLAEIKAKNMADACQYMDPRTLTTCQSQASQIPASEDGELPYFSNGAIGYTVEDGSKALVGTTGTFCSPTATPECFTNTQPAAIFSAGGKTFSELWSEAVSNTSANTYTLTPAILIFGEWYVYAS